MLAPGAPSRPTDRSWCHGTPGGLVRTDASGNNIQNPVPLPSNSVDAHSTGLSRLPLTDTTSLRARYNAALSARHARDVAFSNLWPTILRLSWSRKDILSLAWSHPNLIPVDEVQWVLSDRGMKAQVVRKLQTTHLPKMDCSQLMDRREFERMMLRAVRFPDHPAHAVDALCAAVLAHRALPRSAEAKSQRRHRLRVELERHGCKLRPDSCLCASYIEGSACVSEGEVVAVMRVTKALFDFGHQAWSEWAKVYEGRVEERVFKEGMGWKEATDKEIESDRFRSDAEDSIKEARMGGGFYGEYRFRY
ncbi:hypothetical protein HK101_005133 [Irineochytrium annulatum]|nr:hypothetical protein HK101_005133 [Irineochytrium annulatum]